MKIEQGYRCRVDEDGPKRIKAGEDQEGLQGQMGNGAFQFGDGALDSAFPASDSRKGKSLRFLLGEGSEDEVTIARSMALQEAVCQGVMQAQRLLQQHQQSHPQQTSVVHWERFLPRRQLQVLLVEDDDATRHIVSALLRNCSYEVTPAANGLLAWELLIDQTTQVDLVLTEVVMPCLSGIGLLGRIMSHEALKHIPVIMMSSHDSMNVVFKCLSNGAVDFLVKPVRKNELKNLWQHVWRRCNSSSGSRSASGSQTQKITGLNGASDPIESGSNDESDKTSSEINIRGGSDNGSGTQSRWTKGALEVESCHQSNKPNSAELKVGSGLRPANSTEGHGHHEGKGVDKALASDLATANPAAEATYLNNVTSTCEVPGSVYASVEDAQKTNKYAGSGSSQGNTQRAVDLLAVPYIKEQDSNEEQQGDNEDDDDLLEKHASNSPSPKDKNLSGSSSPSLPDSSNLVKLSVKRPREVEDQEQVKGVRGGLIHSYTSAFSRYNTSSNFTPMNARTNVSSTHAVNVGCENGMPVRESHTVSVIFSSQKENAVFSNHGSDEMFARPVQGNSCKLESLPESSPSAKYGTTSKEEVPSLPPVPGSCPPSKQPIFSGIPHAVHRGASAQVGESGEAKDCVVYNQDAYAYSHTNNYSQYHHHSHHHHHHHHIQHHYHHVSEDKLHSRPKIPQPTDQTVTDVGDGAPRCGSSNMANGAEGIIGPSGSSNGYGSNGNGAVSVNGSATGSNYGSNGQSAAAMMPGGENTDVNAQVEPDNALHDSNGVMAGHDESRFARREAALTKFRQKRKERCFEKKVRYQSRKRLAEQRPRVRGQFVKQTQYGSTIGEPEQN